MCVAKIVCCCVQDTKSSKFPDGRGGETATESKSEFEEDAGFDHQRLVGGEAPYKDSLEARPNEAGLKVSSPDLFQETLLGDGEGNSPMERRMRYCKELVRWAVTYPGRRDPVWVPAPTYGKQEHDLTFAMFIQPRKPNLVMDIRGWLPPSCRKSMLVRMAVQSLLANKEINQKTWGRGVVLYVGEAPKLNRET